jgi:signal transduction histidine kinase
MQRGEPSEERRAGNCRRSNAYRIDIVDSGSGIPDEERGAVFEAYVSRSGGQDRAALGLGLAISKTIINEHNGDIFAPSRKSGTGFSFMLPFVPSDLRRKPMAAELLRPQKQAVI